MNTEKITRAVTQGLNSFKKKLSYPFMGNFYINLTYENYQKIELDVVIFQTTLDLSSFRHKFMKE